MEPIKRMNEKIALLGTKLFGNMWAFYLFFIWGLLGMLPGIPQNFKNLVLLISSAWIQLWALPLLAVGNSVLNKSSERRAKEQHKLIKEEFALQKSEIDRINNLKIDIDALHEKIDILIALQNKSKKLK